MNKRLNILIALILGLSLNVFSQINACISVKSMYPLPVTIDSSLNQTVVVQYHDQEGNPTSIQYSASYLKGLLHGTFMTNRSDGHRYCKGQFNQNRKSGLWTFYHNNNVISEEGWYDPDLDSSFLKADCLVTPFLDPSYALYGIDSIASIRDLYVPLIPYLNIGYNKYEARTGFWVTYNTKGEMLATIEYRNGRVEQKIPYNPADNKRWEDVIYTSFKEGQNQWYRIAKTELNTKMPTYFVFTSFENPFGTQVCFPKFKPAKFYPLANRPVTEAIDSIPYKDSVYLIYRYHIKNCYEDGPFCNHGHMPGNNTVFISPELGKLAEVIDISLHPVINVLDPSNFEAEESELCKTLLSYILDHHADALDGQEKHVREAYGL